MGTVHYRLVALDLDGTLLNSRQQISPRTWAALQAARSRGMTLVVATGRTLHGALYWSRRIGGGPVICCNGGGVLDASGALIFQREIPSALLERALEIARESGMVAHCYTPVGAYLDQPLRYARRYVQWLRPAVGGGLATLSAMRAFLRNRTRIVRNLVQWARDPHRPPVLKVILFGPPETAVALGETLERSLPGLHVSSSGEDNLEITASGVTKGSGLERLAARLKIPREAIVAFGDADNDREMLEYAGLGVAMATAPESVRAVADRVTAPCDDDGVAQVLEELCGG
ncbi:MAG TPA: Cof-type HAD-IIB family hydrolase [Symbiobacteriaceae bacterium]